MRHLLSDLIMSRYDWMFTVMLSLWRPYNMFLYQIEYNITWNWTMILPSKLTLMIVRQLERCEETFFFLCLQGAGQYAQSMCQTLMTMDELIAILNHDRINIKYKIPFARYLTYGYMQSSKSPIQTGTIELPHKKWVSPVPNRKLYSIRNQLLLRVLWYLH